MPYLTTRKNQKLQLGPGLVASYDIQPGNGVGLFWDTKKTHTFTYLLTFRGPTRVSEYVKIWEIYLRALQCVLCEEWL